VGVGFQPAVAALLVLAQLSLAVMGAVGLLGGYRQRTRQLGRLAIGGRLVGGQSLPRRAGGGRRPSLADARREVDSR